MMPGFSTIVNILDYSTSVLPVTKVDKNIDVVDVGYVPLNAQDEKVHLACKFVYTYLSIYLSGFIMRGEWLCFDGMEWNRTAY